MICFKIKTKVNIVKKTMTAHLLNVVLIRNATIQLFVMKDSKRLINNVIIIMNVEHNAAEMNYVKFLKNVYKLVRLTPTVIT